MEAGQVRFRKSRRRWFCENEMQYSCWGLRYSTLEPGGMLAPRNVILKSARSLTSASCHRLTDAKDYRATVDMGFDSVASPLTSILTVKQKYIIWLYASWALDIIRHKGLRKKIIAFGFRVALVPWTPNFPIKKTISVQDEGISLQPLPLLVLTFSSVY